MTRVYSESKENRRNKSLLVESLIAKTSVLYLLDFDCKKLPNWTEIAHVVLF